MPWSFFTASGALKNAEYVGSEFPAGTIVDYGGTNVPTGWLQCDGSTLSRTTYSGLFAVIGTAYGAGDGSTTFKIPDATGKIIYATPGLKLGPTLSLALLDSRTFTSSTTYTIPTTAKIIYCEVVGGGQGGTAGARNITIFQSTFNVGGVGGSGGYASFGTLVCDGLSTLTITVGAGGSGASAPASAVNSPSPGSGGLSAVGMYPGRGGGAQVTIQGNSAVITNDIFGLTSAGAGGAAGNPGERGYLGGGGGGGGTTDSGNGSAGGSRATTYEGVASASARLTGGAGAGGVASNGSSAAAGTGGGGGGGAAGGFSGGNGAVPGGGGGGGGATGSANGAGGAGGGGQVKLWVYG